MRRVLADPDLPGPWVVKGWRRRRPDFDHVVGVALAVGHRRRMAARRGRSPELAETICDRIAAGATLQGVSDAPDMPSRRTVQRWMRQEPGFAAAVRVAAALRDELAVAARPETLDAARRRVGEIRRTLGRRRMKRRREAGD
jgi:hypothetical protein